MNDAFYYAGRLSEATAALSIPVSAVQSQINSVRRCAADAPNAVDRKMIEGEIRRLEAAADTLREVLSLGKPALRLVAAE